MTDRLTHKQTAALFALMVLGRKVPNPELQTLVGFTLTGKELTQLIDAGYVASEKGPRRAWIHELTDHGWAWTEGELAAGSPPPPRPQSVLCTALYLVAARFGGYLREQGKRPVDAFAAGAGPAGLEDRIRSVYHELVREPRGWVGLVDLRPRVGAPSGEVDAVLRELSGAGKIHLVPEDNRKALTAADHEAAIRIGGEDNHLLSIDAP